MPYLTSFERLAMEDGRVKGREEGIEQGIEQGARKELLDVIRDVLKDRFGAHGSKLMPKVRAIEDLKLLRAMLKQILKASRLDDVRSIFQ